LVSTSVAGYGTVLRVNSSIYNVVGSQTVTLNGITMQTIEVRLSVRTVLMAFKLTNVNTAATLADICLFTDTAVGPNESYYFAYYGCTGSLLEWRVPRLESYYRHCCRWFSVDYGDFIILVW
jgi:hypothetical protein